MEELERFPVDKKGRILDMKANKYTNAEIADALGVSANTVSKYTSTQIAQALDYMEDPVNHPVHYTDGKYETIEFIERHGLSFHEGNAVKYISRAGKKDPGKTIEDLEKALWYIKRASNAENYCPEAITAHDYILDKKLSPALASALALIEASEYEKAEGMLEAEIKRLKAEKSEGIQNGKDEFSSGVEPYRGKVVCCANRGTCRYTPGKVYSVTDEHVYDDTAHPYVRSNYPNCVFSKGTFTALRNDFLRQGIDIIEFKGEV